MKIKVIKNYTTLFILNAFIIFILLCIPAGVIRFIQMSNEPYIVTKIDNDKWLPNNTCTYIASQDVGGYFVRIFRNPYYEHKIFSSKIGKYEIGDKVDDNEPFN